MQIRNTWLPHALLMLIGAALGWAVAHARFGDVRLQVVFLMGVAAVIVITSVMLGGLLPGGRDVKLSRRRLAGVVVLFPVVVGLGYLAGYLGWIPTNSWFPLLIGALGVLSLFIKRKWASSRKKPP
jgi:hypothetical protein